MRSDYCPVANEPCQCMCLDGCRIKNNSRKPLTVEQLRDIKEHQRLLEELGPVWAPMLYYFCQAIERAHGIGEKE